MKIYNVRIPKKIETQAFYVTADGRLFDELPEARRHARKLCDATVRYILVRQDGRILKSEVAS